MDPHAPSSYHTTKVALRQRRVSPKRTSPSRSLCVGDTIGPYHLCYELGRGGMAHVYLARCQGRAGLHRFVALKCIRPSRTMDRTFVDMFRDEARIASLLAHPHVCSVLDFDVADGTYYLAMEHLVGVTLERLRPKLGGAIGDLPGGLTEARRAAIIARMIADACEGLHAAHELVNSDGARLDVVHRDVSPQNLMLTFDGCMKVLDFGVASAADQRHKTLTGEVKGKFSYLQPEVLQGLKPDRRADVWGLGVVCWELLTGRRLFHRDNDAATIQAVASADIPPPSGMRAGIPREYDEVVLRALERNREDRYPTARAFGRALTECFVQQGLAVGLADLAELMEALFPGLAPARRNLLEVVSQVEESTAIRLSTQAIEVVTETDSSTETPAARLPTPIPLAPPSWRRPWWDLRSHGGLAVGLAGIAIGVFGLLGMASAMNGEPPEPPDEPAAAVVPVPVAAPPPSSTVSTACPPHDPQAKAEDETMAQPPTASSPSGGPDPSACPPVSVPWTP